MRALVLALLALGAIPAAAAPDVPCAGASCPDLTVDAIDALNVETSVETFAPAHCAVAEGLVEPGERTLLRFPLATANVGAGALLLGRPQDTPAWFTDSPCHGHSHFDGYAAYRLWTPTAFAAWTKVRALEPARPAGELLAEHPALADAVVSGRKQGFCLLDSERLSPLAGSPAFGCGFQGLSPGWADRYVAILDGQWVDVTGLASGYYVLELEVNPERRIAEEGFRNNAVSQLVWVG